MLVLHHGFPRGISNAYRGDVTGGGKDRRPVQDDDGCGRVLHHDEYDAPYIYVGRQRAVVLYLHALVRTTLRQLSPGIVSDVPRPTQEMAVGSSKSLSVRSVVVQCVGICVCVSGTELHVWPWEARKYNSNMVIE